MSPRPHKMHPPGRALLAGAVLLLGSSLSADALPPFLHSKPLVLRTVGTDVVTSAADDGTPGTLRSVLAAAAPGDTVTFDPAVFAAPQTITLNGSELDISQDVTIQGPGASLLTLDANQGSYVFYITGGTVAISGLTAANGKGTGDDGDIVNGGTLTLTNVALTGSIGTALDNENVLSATNCTFSGTAATSVGAVYNAVSAALTNCTFSGNSAGDSGGAFYNTATATLTGCTFRGNTAANGGGALNNYGTANLGNCTFAANTAGYGGAVYDAGTLTVTSCTFSGSTATQTGAGGGLCEDGAATVTGCLFTGSSGGDIDVNAGTATSGGSNLLGDAAGNGDFSTAGAHDQFGVTTAQAGVGPLASNGGLTQTCALLSGSPAIDADYNSGSSVDQRGVPRPQGVRNDIGAYEAAVTLTSITVAPAAPPSLLTGATQQFAATAHYSDGTTSVVTGTAAWASDNAADATVSSTGLATGVAAGTAHISAAFGGQTGSVLLTVTAPPVPVAYVLWNSADGQVQVRAVNSDGSQTTLSTFGPYTDAGDQGVPGNTALWRAVAVAHAPDGTLRLLWDHPDGRVMLWRLNASGTPLTITGYGPYDDQGDAGVPGNTAIWHAIGLSVGADGLTHLLWDHPDGRAMLWNVNADDTFTVIAGYGPYSDAGDVGVPGNTAVWHATGLTNAADGSFRLLWNHPDGRVMLWNVGALGSMLQVSGYGPYSDAGDVGVPGNTALWRAIAVRVGGDGNVRLLWDHPDGRTMLWSVNSSLSLTGLAGYGPYTDPPISAGLWHSLGLALTPSGLPYVLWGHADGRTVLWNIASDGTVGYSGIFEAASDSAGQPWLPTAISGD